MKKSKTKTINDRLLEVLESEGKKFVQKPQLMGEIYSKFSRMGIDTKPTYNLPLKDTIGKVFNEQIQFRQGEIIGTEI